MSVDRTYEHLIQRRFGEYRRSRDEFIVRCPFCTLRGKSPDTKFKLYINPSKNVFNCFRCGYTGHAANLLPLLGSLEFDIKEEQQQTLKPSTVEPLPLQLTSLDYLLASHPAVSYLQGRGISSSDRILYCSDYKKENFSFGSRLIFPIYQFGVYRGFQARTLTDHSVKYIGATNMSKSSLLYNFDTAFAQTEELIITEGIFDCFKAGPTSVAIFGKSASDAQLRLINLNAFKRVYVFLDPEAHKEIKALARKLAENFRTFTVTAPEGEDPGSLSYTEIRRLISDEAVQIY